MFRLIPDDPGENITLWIAESQRNILSSSSFPDGFKEHNFEDRSADAVTNFICGSAHAKFRIEELCNTPSFKNIVCRIIYK